MPPLSLRLPRDPTSVATACDQAEALAAAAGWGPEDVTRAVLATGEAVGNAVEHGAEETVSIRFALVGGALRAWVDDGGPGPDPSGLASPALPDAFATAGRGLYILSALAEDVAVEDGALCFTVRPRG